MIMKIKSSLLILITLLFVVVNLPAQHKDDFTIKFLTLGNCYTCKVRVEAKLNSLEGVISSIYDPTKTETTVTYDDFITDAYIIMQAVADTGHDTEWFRAPDAAYELLVGTCCEYARTIDYSEAQVGYLSLMDLWMGHVAIDEMGYMENVAVYPSLGQGIYTISLNDLPSMLTPQIQVFALNGQEVLFKTMGYNSNEQIDISSQPNGTYVLIISSDNQVISRTKIIKQ